MKKITVLTMVVLLMGMVAAANAANFWTVGTIDEFNYYNVEYSGTTAIVENFNGGQLNTPGLSIDDGLVYAGIYQLGYYQNIVDKDTTPASEQTFKYTSMHGFGGWFDLANVNGQGCSIDVYVGATLVGNIPNTFTGQFWGVFSGTPFNAVIFKDGGLPGQETYQIVDLAICPAPLPGALLLVGSGLLGMVGLRRRS